MFPCVPHASMVPPHHLWTITWTVTGTGITALSEWVLGPAPRYRAYLPLVLRDWP